jgi:ectoine hydroxylase-related dioxygenase (phytanoyl-CoA dioxygenase family)
MLSTGPAHAPTPTDDLERGLADLADLGYAIHTDFIDGEMLRRLSERVNEQAACERDLGVAEFSRRNPNVPGAQMVSFLPNKGRVFIDLMRHPLSMAYAEGVLRTPQFRLFSQNALVVPPGAESVGTMHIDQQMFGFMLPQPIMVNVMVVIDGYNEQTGATRLVPGSHYRDLPNMADDQKLASVAAEAPPGSAVIWEGRTWHRAGSNTGDGTRVSVTTIYCRPVLNPQNVFVAGLHDVVYNTLDEEELRLLGFETVNGTNRICPRYPNDRRQNFNYEQPYVPELHSS